VERRWTKGILKSDVCSHHVTTITSEPQPGDVTFSYLQAGKISRALLPQTSEGYYMRKDILS